MLLQTLLRARPLTRTGNLLCSKAKATSQEFCNVLQWITDGLDQQTLSSVCIAADTAASTSYDENWEHVARKGKSNVTRGQEDVHGGRTLTSQIFGGAMHSTVKAARAKASVTVQPFNLLHLDIQGVNNVTAALQMLTKPEDIPGEILC